jgi:hypothetical protein
MPVSVAPVSAEPGSVTIDLHTKTALGDIDVTLDNGYVDIYAVTRVLETVGQENGFVVGKESL